MVTASDSGERPADEEVTRFMPRLLNAGDVIGHYRIVRLLGRGGSGAIYEARNVHNDGERAALKIVQPDIPDRAIFFDLLRAEANALQEVKHDAVVQFRTFGRIEASDEFYLVIEFVEGPTLAQAMRKQALTAEDVRRLAMRLADGLEAAHAQGVIHRDLSPDNVILPDGEVGRATLIDFSIARNGAFDPIGAAFAGKYSYAAPEQFAGDMTAIGPWTDLYTLGLVLAAAARGRKLDMGNDAPSAIAKRLAVPALDEVPEELHGPIAALLEPDPAKRVRTAAEAAALFAAPTVPVPIAVAPVRVEVPVTVPPLLLVVPDTLAEAESVVARIGSGRHWLWIAAAVLALAGAGAVGLFLMQTRQQASEVAALPAATLAPVPTKVAPAPAPTPASAPAKPAPPPARIPAIPKPVPAAPPGDAPVTPAPPGDAPAAPKAPLIDPRLAETIDRAKAAAATAKDAAVKAEAVSEKARIGADRGRRAADDAIAAATTAQEASDKACGAEPPAGSSCADNDDGSHYGGENTCAAGDCAEPDHGVGTVADDPKSYVGLWKGESFIVGCDVANGAYEYCGPWKDLALSGFGTLAAVDGAITAGAFEEGAITGPGEIDLSAVPGALEKTLRGEDVASGAISGYGVVAWKSGDVSSGKWDGLSVLSEGVMVSATGVRTASIRAEGSPPIGLVTYKDGRSYLGEFSDDGHFIHRMGLGVLYDAKGAIVQQGRWQDDALVADFAGH